jgi:Tfp pilus assembly protein PilV
MATAQIKTKSARANREKGSSFIEILIALAILMILMIGILSMFSMACVVNVGSAARTEMTYKCQQVVDNIRYIYHVSTPGKDNPDPSQYNTTIQNASGVVFPLANGTYNLPYSASDPYYDYWGPNGANVIEPNAQYRMSYTVVAQTYLARTVYQITVSAIPIAGAATRYHHKQVDYVATLY